MHKILIPVLTILIVPFFLFVNIILPTRFNTKSYAAVVNAPIMGVDVTTVFGCDFDENKISTLATSLVSSGLKDLGYRYIQIRDCWQQRDTSGALIGDPYKFPHGIDHLIASVHALGLKIGLSVDLTSSSCAHAVGSQGHYRADSAQLVKFGVDMLTVSACDSNFLTKINDRCRSDKGGDIFVPLLNSFYTAIASTHHFILLNSAFPAIVSQQCTNQSPMYSQSLDLSSHRSQLWLYGPDSPPSWDTSINNYTNALNFIEYQQQGRYGNAGVLALGRAQLTPDEEKTELALWSILGSPIFLGVNPANLTAAQKELLKNHFLITVDQNSMANGPVYQVYRDNVTNVLLRQLSETTYAAAIVTLTNRPFLYSIPSVPWELPQGQWEKTDVFTGQTSPFTEQIRDISPTHGVRFYILHATHLNSDPTTSPASSTPTTATTPSTTARTTPSHR